MYYTGVCGVNGFLLKVGQYNVVCSFEIVWIALHKASQALTGFSRHAAIKPYNSSVGLHSYTRQKLTPEHVTMP